jgi:cysteine desulfurase
MIYLDHNATTPLDERVLEAMLPFLQAFYGNPSALHRQGRLARSAIDSARGHIAALVDAEPNQIIFTGGGTEANNLALTALKPKSRLAISATEHPSVMVPAWHLNSLGYPLDIIPVDANGLVLEDAVEQLLEAKPDLVSVMLANNETGAIQDLAHTCGQLRATGIKVHTDAIQALGKIPVSFKRLGVHLMSLSSHKIYGPKGCGALVMDANTAVIPLVMGGGQEQGLRPGTENVAAIVGFGKAAELAKSELDSRFEHLSTLRQDLEQALLAIPRLTVFAGKANRLPNTVQFGIEGVDGEMLLMQLDQKGIAVSSGSACASGGGKPSAVLSAMGLNADQAKTAIRVSLGITNTAADISEFINILKGLVYQA